jgi:hypothetical protein
VTAFVTIEGANQLSADVEAGHPPRSNASTPALAVSHPPHFRVAIAGAAIWPSLRLFQAAAPLQQGPFFRRRPRARLRFLRDVAMITASFWPESRVRKMSDFRENSEARVVATGGADIRGLLFDRPAKERSTCLYAAMARAACAQRLRRP